MSVWSLAHQGEEKLIYPTAGPFARGGSLALIWRVAGWRLSVAVSVPSVFCRYLFEKGHGIGAEPQVRFDVGMMGHGVSEAFGSRMRRLKVGG